MEIPGDFHFFMYSFKTLADSLDLELHGADVRLLGISTPFKAAPNELSVIFGKDVLLRLKEIRSKALLVDADLVSTDILKRLEDMEISYCLSHSPREHLALLIEQLIDRPKHQPGIHPTSVIGEESTIADSSSIGPYCIIGKNCHVSDSVNIYSHVVIGNRVEIGNNTVIHPNVTIADNSVIGNHVILQAGCVIGSDGFGYYTKEDGHHRIPHMGCVVLEDDVEIGSNSTIDRATIGETRIRKGTKIDNLVQIAHNVLIGENCLIAAQVGIAGSTEVGNRVTIAGQAGLVGHIHIGDDVTIGAQSGVIGTIRPNQIVSGYPARNHRQALKNLAYVDRLADFEKRLDELWRVMVDSGGVQG